MAKIAALSRKYTDDIVESLRAVIVSGCALALIFAGAAQPF
ncbi:hypothetical protein [Pontixanthobacter aquaemixtae]|nr:hypothetical protein [Pontixanthobacter aquaemixtae]